ncbi:MAG: Nramp family divalent metal transporter [Planctomycetes bacterium]|nr:Nramp family divalent metal transporter [Planctomycetota bacterium]
MSWIYQRHQGHLAANGQADALQPSVGPALPVRSLEEVHGTVPVGYQRFWRRLFAFAGPAYMVSVGYMDPGNWATDIEGGSRFSYELIWVLLMSNAMAVLLQTLSARMGIVAGRDLAQACREVYSRQVGLSLWVLCEIAIAACDLAEVIGTIIGLKLLLGIPYQWGLMVTACDTFLLLAIQRFGIRRMEAFILSLVMTIGLCFALEIFWAGPDWGDLLRGMLPTFTRQAPFVFSNNEALYVAIGILGATVMPHNLYLHSALVQSRRIERTRRGLREACRLNLIDSTVALNAAFFVNSAILVMSAATFYRNQQPVARIEDAHELLAPLLGTAGASLAFAIGLLCSGQSSTLTGTLAGQIVMEGFLQFRMRPWLRRLLTRSIALVPAIITVACFESHGLTELLILSQVVLSLQLPFAVVPLIQFTSDRNRMGQFANRLWVKVLSWSAAVVIISLNVRLVVWQIGDWINKLQAAGYSPLWIELTVVPIAIGCGVLLVWLLLEPRFFARLRPAAVGPTARAAARDVVHALARPEYRRIGVAVENEVGDTAALQHAVELARSHNAELILLHVVEGVGGQWYGQETADQESRSDAAYVDQVAEALRGQGVAARGVLRYGNPPAELVKAIGELGIDFVVLGAHGHGFWGDRVFGQTIEALRHAVSIPVLAVREPTKV